MLDIVIGAIMVLIAAVMALFLILLTLTFLLVRKLRSIIPSSPAARPAVGPIRAHGSERPSDEPQFVARPVGPPAH